jgi:hypothetical protein
MPYREEEMQRFYAPPFRAATVGVAASLAILILAAVGSLHGQPAAGAQPVMPRYDAEGALKLPENYRQWVFVGSSLGLSYSEGQRGAEMFHHTLMEPSAYEHYARTGTFREGTMFALLLHGTKDGVLPGRQGRFAGDLMAVEMSVKDTTHLAEGWGYYNFGGPNGIRQTAKAMPKNSCYSCHHENAASDHVFIQFYPLLAAAHAPAVKSGVGAEQRDAAPERASPATPEASAASQVPVAVGGLDPVLLVEGREERGKPEIVAEHGGYRYFFVSEPDRVQFVADPTRFAIQNRTHR